MIRVTVEIVPFGIGEPKILGVVHIANDGTGDRTRGNYKVGNAHRRTIRGRWESDYSSKITLWPRWRGWKALVALALLTLDSAKKNGKMPAVYIANGHANVHPKPGRNSSGALLLAPARVSVAGDFSSQVRGFREGNWEGVQGTPEVHHAHVSGQPEPDSAAPRDHIGGSGGIELVDPA